MLNHYSTYEKVNEKGAYNINLFHISNIWQPLSPAADTISTRNLQSKRREAKRGHKESPEKKIISAKSSPLFSTLGTLEHQHIKLKEHYYFESIDKFR